MARNDGIDRTVARNQDLETPADVAKVQEHNEREKDSYSNQDIVPERTSLNVHFKAPTYDYVKMFEQMEHSAWRQFRKRNGYPTAITQNVEYLLDSVQASTMLSNSEFVVMLNQAFSDRAKLSKLLNISDEQMSYVTNADAGCGLIKYGSALVPFINRFPKDTELYRLMTTRPGEGVFGSGNAS